MNEGNPSIWTLNVFPIAGKACNFSKIIQKTDNEMTFQWRSWKSRAKNNPFSKFMCAAASTEIDQIGVQIFETHT